MTAVMPQAQTLPAISVAGPSAMVQVKNVGNNDFIKEYHTQVIKIPAGSSMIVMWEVMVYWMGNPALADASIRQKDRTRDYDRLRVLYGAYEDDAIWEMNRPHLEVYSLDGERIWTVAEDPTGEHITPASQTVAYAQTYENQIGLMQKQIDALSAMVAQGAGVTPPVPDTPVAPAEPEQVIGAVIPTPPAPMPPVPPFQPPGGPFPLTPPPGPPFNNTTAAPPVVTVNPADNGGKWIDTTRPPVAIPPFKAGGEDIIPEDTAQGPRIS